jgi:hypothetical protein
LNGTVKSSGTTIPVRCKTVQCCKTVQFLGLLTLNIFEGLISSSEKMEKKPKLRAHRQKRRKLFSTLVRNQANPIFDG